MEKVHEHFASVLLLIVCALWLGYSGRISDVTMPGTPGPKFFPFIIVGLLAFLTILNEVLSFSHSFREKKQNTYVVTGTVRPGEVTEQKKTVLSFIFIFLYILGIDFIGFYISTLLSVFLILRGIIEIQKWTKVLITTVIITGSIYIVFSVIFRLPLPRGIAF